LSAQNPYKFPAGPELDAAVHSLLFASVNGQSRPSYSTDEKLTTKVKAKIEQTYGQRVVIGRTKLRNQPYFARYETGPSTSTEVVAETGALAVARLALIVAQNYSPEA
jgi:hypothetical protein